MTPTPSLLFVGVCLYWNKLQHRHDDDDDNVSSTVFPRSIAVVCFIAAIIIMIQYSFPRTPTPEICYFGLEEYSTAHTEYCRCTVERCICVGEGMRGAFGSPSFL